MWNALLEKYHDTCRRYRWYSDYVTEQALHRDPTSIEEIPILTHDALLKHYYLSNQTESEDGSSFVYFTSGTSGGPRKRIVYCEQDEQHYIAAKTQLFRTILADQNGDICFQRAASDMGTGHAASTSEIIFHTLNMEPIIIPFTEHIQNHVEILRAQQPEILYTMPSILDHLRMHATDCREWGIRKIILVGEICTAEWRQQIAHDFGIFESDITDTYGSIEIGTIAYFHHGIGRYVVLDGLVAESVSLDEQQVLVLTAFHRQSFPALRYLTNDVVRDLRTMVVDGEERQTFEAIVGRVGLEWKHGEKISLYDIEQVVLKYVPKCMIRVQLNERRALRIHLRAIDEKMTEDLLISIRRDLEQKIPEIGAMIKNQLLDQIEVFWQCDEALFAHKGQKMKKIHQV